MTPDEHALLTELLAQEQASTVRTPEQEAALSWWRAIHRRRHQRRDQETRSGTRRCAHPA